MSTIHYDRSKSNTSAERLKDFTSCEDDTMRYLETEGVPGIGKETSKAFALHGIESAKDLITKFNRFKRATRTHEDVAERFFQFLRLDVGGTANMHTICEAIETYVREVDEKKAEAEAESESDEESDEEDAIMYDASMSKTRPSTLADFVRSPLTNSSPLIDVPGIGAKSIRFFKAAGITNLKQLVQKYRTFARTYEDGEAAEGFFQWQREEVGGQYNKHTVTESLQTLYLERINEL